MRLFFKIIAQPSLTQQFWNKIANLLANWAKSPILQCFVGFGLLCHLFSIKIEKRSCFSRIEKWVGNFFKLENLEQIQIWRNCSIFDQNMGFLANEGDFEILFQNFQLLPKTSWKFSIKFPKKRFHGYYPWNPFLQRSLVLNFENLFSKFKNFGKSSEIRF